MRTKTIIILLGALLALVVAASAQAATQSVTDPADSPGAADVRAVRWTVENDTATAAIDLTATADAVDILLFADVDGDGRADRVWRAQRAAGSKTVDTTLESVSGSTTSCQVRDGDQLDAQTVTFGGSGQTNTITLSAPLAKLGGTTFRWAIHSAAAAKGGEAWDDVPDAVTPAQTPNPGVRDCVADQGRKGVGLLMPSGIAFPDPGQAGQDIPVPQPPFPHPPSDTTAAGSGSGAGRPTAAIVPDGTSNAGDPTTLSAAASAAGSAPIVAYQWDFNGDGRYDANTGTRPTATFQYGIPGPHTAGVRVIDATGATDVATVGFTVQRIPHCRSEIDVGEIHAVAPCITVEHPGGANADRAVAADVPGELVHLRGENIVLNGHELHAPERPANHEPEITLDTRAGTVSSTSDYEIRIPNTPAGDLILGRATIEGLLPRDLRPPAGEPGWRLLSFSAGGGCPPRDRDICAKLPGNFPLRGSIDLYVTPGGNGALDVNVGINAGPINATARVLVRTDHEVGVVLESLAFRLDGLVLGPLRVERLQFEYQGPGTGTPLHEGDLWEASGSVILPTPAPARVAGLVRFVDGRFNLARLDLTIPGGVPVGPGVLLNRFAAELGLDPLRIGGGLGASLAGVAQVNGNVLVEDAGGVGRVRVDGDFSLLGQPLASAYFEVLSSGYVGFGGRVSYQYPPPPERDPLLQVDGGVEAWFEGAPGGGVRWQAEGDVHVHVWIIDAGARVLANTTWIAGCAHVEVLGVRLEGKAALNHRTGALDVGFGCDLGPYRIVSLMRPRAALGGGASGGGVLSVEPGQRALALELTGEGGRAPVVTLQGPDGKTYTTPTEPGKVAGEQGRWLAAQWPQAGRTVVRIERPQPGPWKVVEAADSAKIVEVRGADAIVPPKVTAHVVRHGGRYVLDYRASGLPAGRKLQLVERGKKVAQVLGVVGEGTGRIAFRSQAGGDRRRQIVATVLVDGQPVGDQVVARFTGAGLEVAARPGRLRLARRPGSVVATWGAARGATAYRVLVRSSDGRNEPHLVRGRRLVIGGVLPGDRVRVEVRGLTARVTHPGPARSARLRA